MQIKESNRKFALYWHRLRINGEICWILHSVYMCKDTDIFMHMCTQQGDSACIAGQFRDRIIFSIRLRFLRFFVGSISNEPTTLSLHMHSISPFQSILVVRNRLVPYHVNKQTNKQTNKQANKQTNKTHKLTN